MTRERPRFMWLRFVWARLKCLVRGHAEVGTLWTAEPDESDLARTVMWRKRVCKRCFTALEPPVRESGKFPRPR